MRALPVDGGARQFWGGHFCVHDWDSLLLRARLGSLHLRARLGSLLLRARLG